MKSLTGRELNQLIGSLHRAPGLVEHVSATVAYVAISTVLSIGNYFCTKKIVFLFAAIIAADAVIYSSVRLITYTIFISLAILGRRVQKINRQEYTKRFVQCMVSVVLGAMLIHNILDIPLPLGMHGQLLFGEIAPNLSNASFFKDSVLGSILQVIQVSKDRPWTLFTGFGPALLSNWGGGASQQMTFSLFKCLVIWV